MKISIVYNGKIKNDFIKNGVNEYLKRMNGKGWQIRFSEQKKVRNKFSYILSEKGKKISWKELENIFHSAKNMDLSFLIGPPDGFDDEYLKGKRAIALSELTFTSELTSLVFIEQLYRFFSKEKGKTYVR